MDEKVDILMPPLFKKTGKIKTRREAYRDGDWIGTFNLWILSAEPVPSIVYQLRSPRSTWAPNKFDVSAGGHYEAGESLLDGLREVREELGKDYDESATLSVGNKVYIGFNTDGTSHNNLIDVFVVQDDSPLDAYKLEEREVYAIAKLPIDELVKVHRDPGYSFDSEALDHGGKKIDVTIDSKSFPENWDNYHQRMALLAKRYFAGEKDLYC